MRAKTKLWILGRKPSPDPEGFATEGFVVRSASEGAARRHAAGDQSGGKVWMDPDRTTCVPLGLAGESGVVLRSVADYALLGI